MKDLNKNLTDLVEKANRHDAKGSKEVIKCILPEYLPDLQAKVIVK